MNATFTDKNNRGLDMIVAFHDIRRPLGNGHEAWLISGKRLDQMIDAGMPAAALDRLRRLIVIVDAEDDTPLGAVKGDLSRLARGSCRGARRRPRCRRWEELH